MTSLGKSCLGYMVGLKPATRSARLRGRGLPHHRHGRTSDGIDRRAARLRCRARPQPAGSRQPADGLGGQFRAGPADECRPGRRSADRGARRDRHGGLSRSGRRCRPISPTARSTRTTGSWHRRPPGPATDAGSLAPSPTSSPQATRPSPSSCRAAASRNGTSETSRCYDPEGLEAFVTEMRAAIRPPVELHEIEGAHQRSKTSSKRCWPSSMAGSLAGSSKWALSPQTATDPGRCHPGRFRQSHRRSGRQSRVNAYAPSGRPRRSGFRRRASRRYGSGGSSPSLGRCSGIR